MTDMCIESWSDAGRVKVCKLEPDRYSISAGRYHHLELNTTAKQTARGIRRKQTLARIL